MQKLLFILMQSANDLCDSIPLSQKQFLILLYREIEENIIKRVKISSPKGIHNIDQIWYHFKFGWVISCEAGRAYLGKIDLPQADIQIGIHSYFSSKADIRGTRKLFMVRLHP